MSLAPSLRQGQVSLEPFPSSAVTDTYVAWLRDRAVMGATESGDANETIASAKDYVDRQNASSGVAFWRILHDAHHVGNLRASGLDGRHGRAAIALIIGERRLHGRGIGSTAITLATRHLFECDLRKVTAGMYATNVASHRAFLRAGYVTEAVLKQHFVQDGRVVDGILVAKFREQGI